MHNKSYTISTCTHRQMETNSFYLLLSYLNALLIYYYVPCRSVEIQDFTSQFRLCLEVAAAQEHLVCSKPYRIFVSLKMTPLPPPRPHYSPSWSQLIFATKLKQKNPPTLLYCALQCPIVAHCHVTAPFDYGDSSSYTIVHRSHLAIIK